VIETLALVLKICPSFVKLLPEMKAVPQNLIRRIKSVKCFFSSVAALKKGGS